MSTTAITTLAKTFGLGSEAEALDVLKNTAFKGNPTDAQMTALCVVAAQYGLNPFTREIYAFPDKGGIVPVVGVDGWARIMNDHPQFDGIDFEQDDVSCTCTIYRKDRAHPITTTEWLAECRRNTQPWQSHPKRMLRHKATIQCARLAFGFSGIFDPDEAERIAYPVDATQDDVPTISETEKIRALEMAAQGVASYRAFYAMCTRPQRKALMSINDEAQAIAEKADADKLKTVSTQQAAPAKTDEEFLAEMDEK